MGERLIAEPVEGVTPDELGDELAAVVDVFDLQYIVEDGYVLTGWPDTGDFLSHDPEYGRLKSVEGLARVCYVYRNDTMMTEAAAYFERVDGEIEHIELLSGDWYGDAIEEVQETYGMEVTEEMVW